MNKKIMPLVLLGLLTVGTLVGCNNDETTTTTPTPTPTTPVTPDPTTPEVTTPEVTTPEVTTPAVVHVESVDLECDALTLYVGDTANLTVTVLPENADDKTYTLDASSEAVTIEGLTVTAASVGTATITVTTNDGAKTDSVNISVLEALPPEPEFKTIPFADETQLEEKVLSYWAEVETVEAETTDWEDGTYEIVYTASEDASWVDLQLLYKNSDLVEGQCYLLEWNLFSDVAGTITVNGKKVEIVEGDNEIAVKYVCGTDTLATTGLYVFFGSAETGLLKGEVLAFELPTWTETSLHDLESENWSKVTLKEPWGGFIPEESGDYWWFDDEPNVTASKIPNSWNFGLVNNETVDANYDISVKAKGTSDWPTQYNEHVGILAWYHDASNYVVAYGDWSTTERPNGMRQFNICSTIGGRAQGACFKDFWGDQPTWANLAQPLSNLNEFKVEVRTKGTTLTVVMFFNGGVVGQNSYDISDLTGEAKAGLYAYGDDTVTFSEYTYTKVEVQEEEQPKKYEIYNVGGVPSLELDENNNATINASGHKMNLVLANSDLAVGKYTVSTFIKSNVGYPNAGERAFGLVPWYVDDNNYIVVYAQYCDWEERFKTSMRELNIVGTINGQDIVNTIGWTDFWADGVTNVDPSVGITLSVTFDNGKISPSINGNPIGYWHGDGDYRYTRDLTAGFTTTDFSQKGKVGFYVNTGNATEKVTFTDIDIKSLVTIPVTHEWGVENQVGNGPVYNVAEDKSISVTDSGTHKSNLILTEDVNAADVYTISASIKSNVGYPNVGERVFGLVPWYVDDNNYIIVYAQYCDWEERFKSVMRELNIIGKIGGIDIEAAPENGGISWTDFWADHIQDVDPSVGITLSVTFDNGKISPSINGNPIGYWHGDGDYRYTRDLTTVFGTTDFSQSAKVGIYVNAGATEVVTFSGFSVVK